MDDSRILVRAPGTDAFGAAPTAADRGRDGRPGVPDEDGSGPVVVGANWYRFRPGERIRHECVASVCHLWIVSGAGTISSRGRELAVRANDLVRLPWRHDVEYRADPRAPFFVGTMHLVPRHSAHEPVVARVAYRESDPLLSVSWRAGDAGAGADVPALNGADRAVAQGVVGLGAYCIETFAAGTPREGVLRALGVLLADLDERWRRRAEPGVGLPPRLRLMTEHALARLSDPGLTVEEIADSGGCSSATARRLFTRHLGQSVHAWLRERRLERAAATLRTSGLRIHEVAQLVGFEDPLYFSRVFSARFGVPPSRYAAGELRP